MREKPYLFSMNGGEQSPLAMGRVDLARMRISAEECENFIPRVIGPAQARPGTQYIGATDTNQVARLIPFIFSATDTALLEFTVTRMRAWVDDVVTFLPNVSTVITNSDFSSSTGWTLTTTGTGVATISGGVLTLRTPGRGDTAKCLRSFSVSVSDDDREHYLGMDVTQGPVNVRVGTTSGGQDVLTELSLETGYHIVPFTPGNGNNTCYIQMSAESEHSVIVNDCGIADNQFLALDTPWTANDLDGLRFDQSGDVIYFTHSDGLIQPQKVIRYGTKAWGIAPYYFTDGPFRPRTSSVTLSANARTGDGTLTASGDFFDANHVGCCFELGYSSTVTGMVLSGDDRFTDTIEVSGNSFYDNDADGTNEATDERDVAISISGTWSGTITVQISYDDGVTWSPFETYTANTTATIKPGYPNSVVLVRAGFIAGDYTSGTPTVTLTYKGGGGFGTILITDVASSTSASYIVTKRLHNTGATREWREGRFSSFRGWPAAVALFEGRLWWGGQDRIAGSVSDNFESFDEDVEGDSAPIIRSIATGPVNAVRWMLGLSRLCIGTTGAEPVARSSSFDEPLTSSSFSIKDASTLGSADVQAVKVDKAGIFVQRSGKRAYITTFSIDQQDYSAVELTRFHPTILSAGVKVMAVQRQPDTRIWFVLDDGTCACLIYEPSEDVLSWWRMTMPSGSIRSVCVLPNTEGDDVYFCVERTVSGTDHYIEKLAYDTQAQGGTTHYMADAFVTDTLAAESTMTGLDHLDLQDVVVWVNGNPIMEGDAPKVFTVNGSGEISLGASYTGTIIAGLAYDWKWKSAKLAYGVQDGNPISRRKKVSQIAPILYKTHIRGIQYGHTFTDMTYMPLVSNIDGATEDTSKVYDEYSPDHQALPGRWDTDARLCLKGTAPLPCTVLALSLIVDAN